MRLKTTTIRDPIHGVIEVSQEERIIMDSPYVQRLRYIKQLGFAEFAFPGATHSRYAHSLGAMHVAGQIMQQALITHTLTEDTRQWLIQMARLAGLLHDIGHSPLSHSSERLMPLVSLLNLPAWLQGDSTSIDRQARHEDYSVHLILHSSLGETLDTLYGVGTKNHLASIISGCLHAEQTCFVRQGTNYFSLLRQIISSECDADRMDYLRRDSFYTGVNYGQYDYRWLVQHMRVWCQSGHAFLALSHRAIFAFEDFLISRYHMFLSVYFHHVPVLYDHMLAAYAQEAGDRTMFPADPEEYLWCDDIYVWNLLRKSSSSFAKRLVMRSPYKLLIEFSDRDYQEQAESKCQELELKLQHASIDYLKIHSAFSVTHQSKKQEASLFVLNESLSQARLLQDYTPIYQRDAQSYAVYRLFYAPTSELAARALLSLSGEILK